MLDPGKLLHRVVSYNSYLTNKQTVGLVLKHHVDRNLFSIGFLHYFLLSPKTPVRVFCDVEGYSGPPNSFEREDKRLVQPLNVVKELSEIKAGNVVFRENDDQRDFNILVTRFSFDDERIVSNISCVETIKTGMVEKDLGVYADFNGYSLEKIRECCPNCNNNMRLSDDDHVRNSFVLHCDRCGANIVVDMNG